MNGLLTGDDMSPIIRLMLHRNMPLRNCCGQPKRAMSAFCMIGAIVTVINNRGAKEFFRHVRRYCQDPAKTRQDRYP